MSTKSGTGRAGASGWLDASGEVFTTGRRMDCLAEATTVAGSGGPAG
jgi:hypothetical protein